MERSTSLASPGLVSNTINSFTNMSPSTCSTYVYSRPVTSSHSIMINGQQQDPSLAFCGSKSEAVRPPQGIIEHQEDVNYRRRTHFTVFQRGELEKVFNQSQYISPQKRQSLSQELGIPKEVLLTWFKNRRAKWRREHRNTGLVRSASTCFSSGLYLQRFSHVPYPNSKLMIRDARMLYETLTAHASDNGQINGSAFN